ncbi:NH(3)-dependent NAD(+) synthase NadE [Gottschalkia acidurici 9a]|uniref:NH(3)-dependent NAD(+) synthetase n=1 Tax=Gottschalkia acidurici (strain ATCC 7906 / DSM 604 / BCRC 14475 / CIP 104303 / KCTC 5404 / NCIMB 10678 / 9a) TaxID=1128398 RepID=K0AZ38_GOTA9|nr:NAD(+) synthase [Gottschalkia acidurici]AFS78057.1 NH(3)-dependent NAD(+) synthase NadE [Gottschalkia acidurici 9a]
MESIEKVCDDLINWLKEKVNDAGSKGVVFGLSGGIDSAVVAALAKRAFPDTSLGVIMPCHSNPQDEEHARLLADTLNLKVLKVDLTDTFDTLTSEVKDNESNKLATSNIKPRLRMTTLYYFAQLNNYLVAGPSNKSEFTTGYFTKHGDSAVDIFPIADFVKEEIFELAKYLGVNSEIINKAPSAGLWENQTDEDEMGFGYKDLDHYIKTGEGKKEIVEKIDRMNKISEHKRKFPPMFTR